MGNTLWLGAAKGYLFGLLSDQTRRAGIRVLCYHGVVNEKRDPRLERNLHLVDDFRKHIRFLSKFRVMSLAEMFHVVQRSQEQREQGVVVTFDDGYANNSVAHEILMDAKIPWSVFVSTEPINTNLPIWTIELSLLMLHGRGKQLAALGGEWKLETRPGREAAFQDIRYKLKRMPRSQKEEVMAEIRTQFPAGEVERLLDEFPSLKLMSWQELRRLKDAGVEIGSHGMHHEIHHEAQPRTVRLQELTDSRKALEENLGYKCRFFAFPNGEYCEASASDIRIAGYDLAFSLQNGLQPDATSSRILPRLTPPSSLQSFVRQFFWEGSV